MATPSNEVETLSDPFTEESLLVDTSNNATDTNNASSDADNNNVQDNSVQITTPVYASNDSSVNVVEPKEENLPLSYLSAVSSDNNIAFDYPPRSFAQGIPLHFRIKQ